MPRTTKPLIERLTARIDAEGPCWEWTGALNRTGYGVIGRGRRGEGNILTHRAAWELLVGPIPEGCDLDHLCRNPPCCNPDHLEPVDRATNVARGARRRGYRDHIKHCPRGHEYDHHNGRQRICRTCNRESASAANARKRAAA